MPANVMTFSRRWQQPIILALAMGILCAPALGQDGPAVTVLRGSSAPPSAPPEPTTTTVVREVVYVPQYYPQYYPMYSLPAFVLTSPLLASPRQAVRQAPFPQGWPLLGGSTPVRR
jgi:hypothetical protein